VIHLLPTPLPLDPPDLRAPARIDPDDGLLHSEEASDRTWWLGGRRTHALFHGLRGLERAHFGGDVDVAGLSWGEGAPASTWISPRAVRLERTSPAGSFVETIWVPERLPGLLVELDPIGSWIEDRAIRGRLRVEIERRADDSDAPVEIHEGGDAAVRWLGLESGEGLLVATFDADGGVEAIGDVRIEGDALVVDLEYTPRDPDARLAIAILGGEPAAASLRSLMVAKAHARRAAPAKEALRTRIGVPEVDDAVAWAWTRIRDRIHDDIGALPPLDDTDVASWVRTALAVGLTDAARAVLPEDPVTVAEADAWEAWASGVGADWLLDELERRVGDAAELSPDVRRRLADVADRADNEEWAAALRTATEPGAPDVRESADPDRPIAPAGDADEWRMRVAADPLALGTDGWKILDGLVGTVLRWRPDAATGRMHLTPSFPTTWSRFELQGLRGDELRMRMEWRREGDVETWKFAPMAGAVPATLILRLPVPGADAAVRVDDVPAELDPEREADGTTRVPIQLQLDRERVVRVEPHVGEARPGAKRVVLPTLGPPSG